MNSSWKELHVERFSKAADEEAIMGELSALSLALGFPYCSYSLTLPVPISKPTFSLHGNLPDGWPLRYKSQQYQNVDPVIQHGRISAIPVVWTDELFALAQDYWADAKNHGLSVGWSKAIYEPYRSTGVLSFLRSSNELSEDELKEKGEHMEWIAYCVHKAMAPKLGPKLLPELQKALSVREREVLFWAAEGKQDEQIGTILGLAARTIREHSDRAVVKMSANTRTQAVVRAYALGLLFL
jgi:DNA-binding CsgD family transcriptional regulator